MFPGMVSDSADIDDSGTKKALDRIESATALLRKSFYLCRARGIH
jgi:hypothetical protein